MIVDFHAHLGTEAFGDEHRLRREYARAGVTGAVLVPGGMIDVRRMTAYVTGEATPHDPRPRNELVADLVRREAGFHGFFCVDPHTGRAGAEALERALREGFSGLKLAPLVHQFSLTSKDVSALLDVCHGLERPVYTHTVYSPAASTRKVGLLATRHPHLQFVIGHMGFGPADQDAIGLAARHDNVFLETSGASFVALEQALANAGAGKLVFGSEFPLHNPRAELQKIVALDLPSADFERVTGANALALLGTDAATIETGRSVP